jgi:2-C-methyl-D-erythritol 4-phosphate cytidylyltransferase
MNSRIAADDPHEGTPSTTPARCFALVPCAGVGERAGTTLPKQYADLAGRPLVAHTLQALREVPA